MTRERGSPTESAADRDVRAAELGVEPLRGHGDRVERHARRHTGHVLPDGGQAASQGAGRSVQERRAAEVDGLRLDQQLAAVGGHRAGRLQGDVAPEDGDLALDARLAVAGVVDRDVLADLLGHGGEGDRRVDVQRLRPQTGLGEPHAGADRHDVDEVALGRHDVLAAQLDRAEPGLVGGEVGGPLRHAGRRGGCR